MHDSARLRAPIHRMLEIFRAVMLHGGISAAARALQMAQPSISRTIGDLERATGLALFAKHGRVAVPTEDALALFSRVDQAFIGLEDILRFSGQLREHRVGWLSVACLPALAHSALPIAIAQLRKKLPHIVVRLQVAPSHTVAQLVGSRQIDLGLCVTGAYAAPAERLARFMGDCRCILPRGHALGKRQTLTVADLAKQPYVNYASASIIRQRVEALTQAAADRPQVVAETFQSISVSNLVLAGVGISVVDPFIAAEHQRRGGLSVRFKPRIPFEVDLIAHSDSRLSEAARVLIAQVKTALKGENSE